MHLSHWYDWAGLITGITVMITLDQMAANHDRGAVK